MTFILDSSKVRALAKPSHVRCHGTGIYGYSPGSGGAIVCRCIWRALEKNGVNLRAKGALQEAFGVDPEPVAAPAEPGTLLGFPIVEDPSLKSGEVTFGTMEQIDPATRAEGDCLDRLEREKGEVGA